jgi:DNA repair ATPase RecN
MDSQIVTLIVAILSSSVFTSVITAIATRRKTNAEADSEKADALKTSMESLASTANTLGDVAGKQLNMMYDQVAYQAKRIDQLEKELSEYRTEDRKRERTMQDLRRENDALTEQVSKLKSEIETKDKQIVDLQHRVQELEDILKKKGSEE